MTEDAVVRVHRGIDDDGRTVWDVTLDGPQGTEAVLHESVDTAAEALRLAEFEQGRR